MSTYTHNHRMTVSMTEPSPTHSQPGYRKHYTVYKPVSSSVKRLQEGLNRYLDEDEKEDLVTALNDYQIRRNVVDFVYNLKIILDTSEKRRSLFPLLRRVIPRSDLDVFDHYVESSTHKYGTTPRASSGNSHLPGSIHVYASNNNTRSTSTLPSSSRRTARSSKQADVKYRDNVILLSNGNSLEGSPRSSQGRFKGKTMWGTNEIFRLLIRQPHDSEDGFGFSIRGGSEYGIGIYISFVNKGSTSEKEGLEPGDLILEVNDISFRNITHEEGAKIIRAARKLDLVICRVGRIPGSYTVHQSYIWMDPGGRPVTPPPELEQIGRAKSGDQRRSGLLLLKADDERKVNLVVDEGASLGLMIRGGREFGLGIYITGVDSNSVAKWAGLKVGDQILDINGQSFLDISHAEAVSVLKSTSHMVLIIKDVGKLPYAKTTVDRTQWLSKDQVQRSHSDREMTNTYQAVNGDRSGFSRGAGSQLMLNSMVTRQWDMLEEQARHLLNVADQETIRRDMDDYQRGHVSVDELVPSLCEVLTTSAKFALMSEIRNLVQPKNLDKFDALVLKKEVEMMKSRQKFHNSNGRHSPSPIDSCDVDQPYQSSNKASVITVNGTHLRHSPHNKESREYSHLQYDSSPESSRENLRVRSSREHETHSLPRQYRDSYSSRTRENGTFVKNSSRHKINGNTADRIHSSMSGADRTGSESRRHRSRSSESFGGQRSRSEERMQRSEEDIMQRSRSEEQMLVTADVHKEIFKAKPVEEMRHPAEGDSGVYMNGSNASDSSSPSGTDRHDENVEKNKKTWNTNHSSSQSNIVLSNAREERTMASEQTSQVMSPAPNNSMDVADSDPNEKYGDIPLERVTIYKSQPTLGLAIEGGANTRQPLPRVISVQPGGSAYESGSVKVGHVLLEINGRCLVGLEHKDAARAIAEAFKNKSLDRMEMLVTDTNTDVKAVFEKFKNG